MKSLGSIHSTKIQTGPTGKRGPPQKVDQFFRNFSGWNEPIHWVLDRNFRKFCQLQKYDQESTRKRDIKVQQR